MAERAPLVFDIARHTLDDGPGIRTTVFFKGCPLSCVWCHNPESIDPELEIGFYAADCIDCGDCTTACPSGAARRDLPRRIDRSLCRRCGTCVDACPGRGLRRIGRHYETDTLLDILLRDSVYYQTSGGGVTLSGGEPTLSLDYAADLLRKLKSQGIHTAIETNGFFEWSRFKAEMLDYLDLILFDVKLADPGLHVRYTGRGNDVILENLARVVAERPWDVIARVPLVPGITATEDNLRAISGLLRELGVTRCRLLPYNPLGLSKRGAIGKPTAERHRRSLAEDELAWFEGLFSWAEVVHA